MKLFTFFPTSPTPNNKQRVSKKRVGCIKMMRNIFYDAFTREYKCY